MLLAGAGAALAEEGAGQDPAGLVKQLGAESFAAREEAQEALAALGDPAEPALREGIASKDPEVASRSRQALARILAVRRDEMLKGLSLKVSLAKGSFTLGEDMLLGVVTLANAGKRPVTLLKNDNRWKPARMRMEIEVKDAEGLVLSPLPEMGDPPYPRPRMEKGDFIVLKPGEACTLVKENVWHVQPVPAPGRYEITVTYRIHGRDPLPLPADADAELKALAASLLFGEIRSVPVSVEVLVP
jgi:hypothetical protein